MANSNTLSVDPRTISPLACCPVAKGILSDYLSDFRPALAFVDS